MKKQLLIPCLLLFGITSRAQSALDAYLAEGLNNNLVVQQKNISLEKSMYALKSANSLFLPTIGVQANYTSGEGGRSIDLPIGDLMNPVYSTLNQLTASNSFPQISNESIGFFPTNFYDAKVHTTLPIINSDLIFNRQIQEQQVAIQNDELDIYKKELIRSIRVAYFTYLSAEKAVAIYEQSLVLAKEGKRVNESLVANGKGLPAYLIRSDAEIEKLNAQITEAKLQATNAQLYFNFLLNRDGASAIDTNYDDQPALARAAQIAAIAQPAASQREELRMMNHAIGINQTVIRMNRFFWTPKVGAFLDLGSQASGWEFNSQSRYYLAGVQLDFPLFSGFRNRYKITQSKFDLQFSQLNLQLMTRQFELSAAVARNAVNAAYANYLSAQKQQDAAITYRQLIDKGYQEGVNTFIETLDARSQQTQAQLATSIARYKILTELANYDRETASSIEPVK